MLPDKSRVRSIRPKRFSTIMWLLPLPGLMFFSLPLQAARVLAAQQGATQAVPATPGGQGFQAERPFPAWPQAGNYQREIIPPPPPGPYMSTALRDYTVTGKFFARPAAMPAGSRRAVAMQALSPDRPWPGDLRTGKQRPYHGYYHGGQSYPAPVYPVQAYPGSGQ